MEINNVNECSRHENSIKQLHGLSVETVAIMQSIRVLRQIQQSGLLDTFKTMYKPAIDAIRIMNKPTFDAIRKMGQPGLQSTIKAMAGYNSNNTIGPMQLPHIFNTITKIQATITKELAYVRCTYTPACVGRPLYSYIPPDFSIPIPPLYTKSTAEMFLEQYQTEIKEIKANLDEGEELQISYLSPDGKEVNVQSMSCFNHNMVYLDVVNDAGEYSRVLVHVQAIQFRMKRIRKVDPPKSRKIGFRREP